MCQVCGREVPSQTAFHLDTASGSVESCCPACALHYEIHHPGAVRAAFATDFNSRHLIPAQSAYYDEGGDTQYCTAMHPAAERGPQDVSMRVYDRCLPTLVAFRTREDADSYQRQHGGGVLTYSQVLEGIRGQ